MLKGGLEGKGNRVRLISLSNTVMQDAIARFCHRQLPQSQTQLGFKKRSGQHTESQTSKHTDISAHTHTHTLACLM